MSASAIRPAVTITEPSSPSQENHEVEPEARVLDLLQQLPQFNPAREKRIWNRAYGAPNLSRKVKGAVASDDPAKLFRPSFNTMGTKAFT